MDIGREFLSETIRWLRFEKSVGDGALEQLEESQLHARLDAESNSVAVIVKHLEGNMRSRWVDFLASDGEKPDRHRDAEFEDDALGKEGVLERWERGWGYILGALEALTPDDLLKTVTIRMEPTTALSAIQRQVAHVSYHVGQIVYLAKLLRGGSWRTLSIPKGGSEAFIARMREKFEGRE